MVIIMEKKLAIGVDIGGTSIKGAAITSEGKVLDVFSMPVIKGDSQEKVVNDLIKVINDYLKQHQYGKDNILGIGLGIPGSIDTSTGVVTYSNNLCWNELPIQDMVQKGTGLPVRIINDANAATYGEAKFGAGKKYKNLIMLTLGTGIGGGIIINGELYEGNLGKGAELGHVIMKLDGEQCSCGRKGCFEAYASATALIRQTKAAMEKDKASKMWEIAGSLDNVNGKTAFDGMRAGDETAKKVCDQYIEYVACGIVDIINTFQPEFVCIGGGISKEKDNLRIPIEQYVDKYRFGKTAKKKTAIKIAQLGNDAGIIGAAFLGLK